MDGIAVWSCGKERRSGAIGWSGGLAQRDEATGRSNGKAYVRGRMVGVVG